MIRLRRPTQTEEPRMTGEMMTLRALVEKAPTPAFCATWCRVRRALARPAGQRNGYRDREWGGRRRGDWPYLWIHATCVKVRNNGRIDPIAVIAAVGVNAEGRREVLGMESAP